MVRVFDHSLNYYFDKVNVVAYALSRKSLHMSTLMVKELDLIERFRDLSLMCEVTIDSVRLGMLKLTSGFLDENRESQKLDVALVNHLSSIKQSEDEDFRVQE